jgi:hypothetical protein
MARGRREVNDFRRRAFGNEPERCVAFVCECADDRCRRSVLLTVVEYDEARASGHAVVIDATHLPPAAR